MEGNHKSYYSYILLPDDRYKRCIENTNNVSNRILQQEIVSQDQLIGIWQTPDFNDNLKLDLASDLQSKGVEIYLTDDSNAYIRFLQETIPDISIGLENDKIVLCVKGNGKEFANTTASYILNKKSEDVPYGFTDSDKQEIKDKDEKIRQDIRACAQKYSAALNLTVAECGEYSYRGEGYIIGNIEHGMIFKIKDTYVCITLSTLAEKPWKDDEYYIMADAGYDGMLHAVPCVVSRDFALAYDENNMPPVEWLNTFMMLYQD